MASHVSTIVSNSGLTYIINAADPFGHKTWHIIKLTPGKQSAFLAQFKTSRPINLSAYGEIIDSGYGEAP